MKSVCVFCASSLGTSPRFAEAAGALGRAIATRGLTLVYGGGDVGLMGVLADAALDAGGSVVGVIPAALVAKELAHVRLTELHVVHSMHERKALMAERADAFVMLPGGFGTLEEFFEALTWAQLGIHQKPRGVLDVDDYYRSLFAFLRHAVDVELLQREALDLVLYDTEPDRLLDQLERSRPPSVEKFLRPDET